MSNRYFFTYDDREVVPIGSTLTKRIIGLYAQADCTANVTWGSGRVENAAPLAKGYHMGFVTAVGNASAANTLFALYQTQIQGKTPLCLDCVSLCR